MARSRKPIVLCLVSTVIGVAFLGCDGGGAQNTPQKEEYAVNQKNARQQNAAQFKGQKGAPKTR